MKKFKMPRVIERSYVSAIDRLMQGLKRELSHVASPFFVALIRKMIYNEINERKERSK